MFCARVEQGERMTREREVFLVRSWDWVQKHSGNNLNLNAQRSHLTVFAFFGFGPVVEPFHCPTLPFVVCIPGT